MDQRLLIHLHYSQNENLENELCAVREFVNKSAASAASGDYVKLQAVIKSAASAASLCGGRAGGRLDHGFFFGGGSASARKIIKIMEKVPKSLKSRFDPKVKSAKMGLSINPRHFCNGQPFFAIFGPARAKYIGKRPKKYKKCWF